MLLGTLSSRTRRRLLLFLALALLFAQGVRLCIHAHTTVDGTVPVAGAPALHLESLPNTDDGAGESNDHLPISLALMKLVLDAAIVVLFTALFLIGLAWQLRYLESAPQASPVTSGAWSLRPPLRAPPR